VGKCVVGEIRVKESGKRFSSRSVVERGGKKWLPGGGGGGPEAVSPAKRGGESQRRGERSGSSTYCLKWVDNY